MTVLNISSSLSSSEGDQTSGESSFIEVEQCRSAIGSKPKHRATLRALGLGKVGARRLLPDRPEIRGMIAKVSHLVTARHN